MELAATDVPLCVLAASDGPLPALRANDAPLPPAELSNRYVRSARSTTVNLLDSIGLGAGGKPKGA